MFDDLSLGFFGRELWEWHDRPQHLSDIGRGQGRQDFEFELLHQFGVTLAFFGPGQLCRGHKPQGTGGQSSMMLPSRVLLCLKLIPSLLVFGVLNHPFDEIAPTQQYGQVLQRSILWRIAEGIGVVTILLWFSRAGGGRTLMELPPDISSNQYPPDRDTTICSISLPMYHYI